MLGWLDGGTWLTMYINKGEHVHIAAFHMLVDTISIFTATYVGMVVQ